MQSLTYAAGSGGAVKLWRGIAAQITVTGVDSPAGTWTFLADDDLTDGAILTGTVTVSGTSIIVSISSTNTTELAEAIQGKEGLRCRGYLTDGSRVIAIPLLVLNRAVSGTPTPVADYYTKAQINALLADLDIDVSNSSARSVAWSDITGKPDIPDSLADLSDDSTHRTVTDAEKATWNGKADFPSGGTTGQYLKKTADGTEWAAVSAGVNSVNGQTGTVVLTPSDLGMYIELGACTSIGVYGQAMSWVDPENVSIVATTLGQWEQTDLVRKQGTEYPASHSDGTVVATTSRTLGNKNYYRDHSFTDETAVSGVTYRYKLFSKSSAGNWNNLTANEVSTGIGLSWYQVQQLVRAGRGAELWPVGTVFYVDHPEYTHNDGTGLWFRVVGHDQVPAQDETLEHTMCLDMVDCLFSAPYDYYELQYALTADTVALAGKEYYTLSGSTYTKLVEGTDYNVGDAVPAASWYEKNLSGRDSYGSNDPVQSNMIQWANSSGAAGNWFTPQTLWDQCSSTLAAKAGFCRFIDSDFLAVVNPAKLTTALWVNGSSASITHYAKFWPLSATQLSNAKELSFTENAFLDFYKNSDPKKVFFNQTSYCEYHTRSVITYNNYPGIYCGHRTVTSGGSVEDGYNRLPTSYYGYSLACIIA